MQLRLLIGFGSEPITLWLSLALSYFAHSLVWAFAAALLTRFERLSSATRHLCWKVALFGPLLSAGAAAAATAGFERPLSSAPAYVRELVVPSFSAPEPGPDTDAPAAERPMTYAQPRRLASGEHWQTQTIAALGVAAAALGSLRFLGAVWLLRGRLRGRGPLADPRLLHRFELICKRMGVSNVAITDSDAISSPLVIGRTEVCVPGASLAKLTCAELDAVICHELAHIERGDGIWFPLASAVQSVLWLHPLNHWLSSRFRETAELACDDRAVDITGNPLSLARALLHVATRAAVTPQPSMTPTMAHSRNALLPRVRRLTANSAPARSRPGGRERTWLTIAVATLGASLSTLGIRAAHAEPKLQVGSESMDCVPQDHVQRIADLAQRELRVTELLAAVEPLPSSSPNGASEAVRALELNQELRHVRATRAWLEQRAAASSPCAPSVIGGATP